MGVKLSRSLQEGPLPANGASPLWWGELRSHHWQKFLQTPNPSRKNEDWRFASVGKLAVDSFIASRQVENTDEILQLSKTGFETAGRVVFANDQMLHHAPLSENLIKAGVIWETIEAAAEKHPELLQKHFMKQPVALGSQKYAALHGAFCRAGMLIYVPKGVEVKLPLAAFHWMEGEGTAVFPHTLLIAEAQSKVTVVDFLRSSGEGASFACALNDIYAAPGSQVTYVASQGWNEQTLNFLVNSISVDQDASVRSLFANLGGSFSRLESKSSLHHSGARSEMLSLSLGDGTQEFDQRTLQLHEAPNTWSDLLYKNALDFHSKSIFKGLIRVDPGASKTDAYQSNRNLLLSGDAEADSMPGLEILNDDVRCTHGATTGQIQEEQLFYLLSRGIPEPMAKRLLAFGFFDDVLLRLGNEAIAGQLRSEVEDKFSRSKDRQTSSLPGKVTEEDPTNLQMLQGTL